MSKPSPLIWILTAVNVAAAVTVVLCTGYVAGLVDGRHRSDPPASAMLDEPTMVAQPQTLAGPVAQTTTRRVVPNPHVGQGHHPTFDCASITSRIDDRPEGSISIGELAENSAEHEGQTVMVRARVVQAFPKIMGVNWFHVCDEPNGRVLVASADQWVPPGHIIVLRGVLSLNRNIAGAYHFPLFLEDARLEGDGVEGGPSPINERVFDL